MTNDNAGRSAGTQPPFAEVLAQTRGVMERFTRMRAVAEQVLVTETSADGGVTVTVNSGGVLTDLRITDRAVRLSGLRIAAVVLDTMRRAQARLANRMNDVMQGTMGEDEETVDRVLAVYRDRFPEPEPGQPSHSTTDTETRFWQPIDQPSAPARTPASRRPWPSDDEDGDWEGPIMQRV